MTGFGVTSVGAVVVFDGAVNKRYRVCSQLDQGDGIERVVLRPCDEHGIMAHPHRGDSQVARADQLRLIELEDAER